MSETNEPSREDTVTSRSYAQQEFEAYWTSIHLPKEGVYLPLYDAARRAFEAGVLRGTARQQGEDRSLCDALDEAEGILAAAVAAHEAEYGDLRPKPEWRVKAEAFIA